MAGLILQEVPLEEKAALRIFLDAYLIELSAFGEFDLSYPFYDQYWYEDNRWPYWIISDDQKIGFIFVDQTSRFGEPLDYFLAEFYILPEYRGNGYGQEAFKKIIALYPGQWELAFFIGHAQAEKFWLKVVQDMPYEQKEHQKVNILRFKA